MTRHFLKPAAGLVLALALTGCDQQSPAADIVGTQVSTDFLSGNHTYDTVCGQCHEVGVGPILRGRQLPAELVTQIARNGMAAMPAFPASAISDEQLAEVAQFIATSPAPEPGTVPNATTNPATVEPTNGN